MGRRRLDAELVRRGLAPSRSQAQEAVNAGRVSVAGITATKAGSLVAPDAPVELSGPGRPFVSRAGGKLAAALDRFAIDPGDRDCLDAGASTGGFTDCLLQRGAARVIAVDVGYGQLAWSLRTDPRVTVMERTNVRDLAPSMLPFIPTLVVADLSFISLRLALPALARLAAPGAAFVVLVKPQFEAGRAEVGRGGVVRDPGVWQSALADVVTTARSLALEPVNVMASPLPGPAGNVEFPGHRVSGSPPAAIDVEAAIGDGKALLR
jgi:23S rRNA (cytidine1920-2'-O)/16S rRNA (cytidine1409-2'-O)-methyltransferase